MSGSDIIHIMIEPAFDSRDDGLHGGELRLPFGGGSTHHNHARRAQRQKACFLALPSRKVGNLLQQSRLKGLDAETVDIVMAVFLFTGGLFTLAIAFMIEHDSLLVKLW